MRRLDRYIISIVAGLLWGTLAISDAATIEEPPDTIVLDTLQELYEAVHFDHATHIDSYDCARCHHHTLGDAPTNPECARCHHDSAPVTHIKCETCHTQTYTAPQPDTPKTPPVYHIDILHLKGAYHLLCLNCHQQESGPTECLDCHSFTEAGRKRFQVNSKDK